MNPQNPQNPAAPAEWNATISRCDIPQFDGKPESNVLNWVNSFNEFLNICRCNPNSALVQGLRTDAERLVYIQRAKEVLGNALQGEPLTYYEGKRDGIVSVQTWNDFISSLKSEFSPGGKRPLQWKREWDELVPNHFPSFLAFAEQVKKVAQYAGETEAAQIDKVRRYAPYDIYPMIAEPADTTFSQLLDKLKEIDARHVYAPPMPQQPPATTAANAIPFMHIHDQGELKADMRSKTMPAPAVTAPAANQLRCLGLAFQHDVDQTHRSEFD